MTINPMELTLRAKKLGVLLRDARKVTCRTIEECAAVVGISVQEYESFEMGERSPSLPQLELLAFYLRVPVEHFWSDQLLQQEKDILETLNKQLLLGLRQRMIGTLIRKVRLEKGLSAEEFLSRTGISTEVLEDYELGKRPIPIAELQAMAGSLGSTMKDFTDRNGPVGSWFVNQHSVQDFLEFTPELREFVTKPVNRPYIELAKRLSELNVEKLRTIAETLLEITF